MKCGVLDKELKQKLIFNNITTIKEKMNYIAFNKIPIRYVKMKDDDVHGKFVIYDDDTNEILINEKLRTLNRENKRFKSHERTLWHEVGHYIHKYYFKSKKYVFSEINKSMYAYTDHYEDFAEAFSDFMCEKKETTIRNLQMESLLRTIF